MGSFVNTGHAVIVLGDEDTAGLADLAEQAAEQGAVIAETHSFARGEAVDQDDLTAVPGVVGALSRALATRTDVWLPFPMPDLGREQHLRRISLVLQRHGLNLLLGPSLEACPHEGGMNEVDFALRTEVRAVDGLDQAALAGGATTTLAGEIERELAAADHRRRRPGRPPTAAAAVSGDGQRLYSALQAAVIFGQSPQWVHRGLRHNHFTRADGSPIVPIETGRGGPRFTVPMLREIALSCFRLGWIGEDALLDLLTVLDCAERE